MRGDKKRRRLYKNLLKVTRKTQRYLRQMKQQLTRQPGSPDQKGWLDTYAHNLPLIETIIDQAERRALQGEKVPASEIRSLKRSALILPLGLLGMPSNRQRVPFVPLHLLFLSRDCSLLLEESPG